MAPFYGLGSTASRLEPLQEGSLLFITSPQKFMVLTLSTSKGWKAESTLEPPSGFERLEPLREGSLLFITSPQKFLVLTLSTLEGWKAESTLEPPSGFEHWTPGLGIQRL